MLRCSAMCQLCLVFLQFVVFFRQLDHFSFQIARLLLKYAHKLFLIRCRSVLHCVHTVLLGVLKGLLLDLLQLLLFIVLHFSQELFADFAAYISVVSE